MNLNPELLNKHLTRLIDIVIDYIPDLISAFLILFIGIYAIRLTTKITTKVMVQRNLDPTLSRFLSDIILWALRILLAVTVIEKLGVQSSSFVAIIGAMGLAVGLSLQGSLSNFAGGMLIIVFKPFKVGDTIEAQGVVATVSEIQIFVTKLYTANNQTVFVPNGALSNGTIINYSMQGERRADLTFAVSYDSDIKKTKEVLLDVLIKNPKVLKKPAPEVFVKNLTASAVEFSVRPWAKNINYGAVFSETLENCKTALDEAGIAIQPYTLQK